MKRIIQFCTALFALCLCLTACNFGVCDHTYDNACDATCNTCGEQRAVAHAWVNADCVNPKTCTVCKITDGAALGHTPANDDGKCDTCGHVIETVPSHKHVYTKLESDANGHWYECDCGAADGNARAHDWKSADCVTPKTCTVCKITDGEALGHTDANSDYVCDQESCNRDTVDGITVRELFVPDSKIPKNWIFAQAGATVACSDESILKIGEFQYLEDFQIYQYNIYALKEGCVIVSFYGADGTTLIERHKYTVTNEKTVHLGEGDLVSDISVDKTTAEVYYDDTLVTYTVTTSADVDRLEFAQISSIFPSSFFSELIENEERTDMEIIIELDKIIISADSLSDTLIANEALGTLYSATKRVEGDTAVWTVKWDLGYTAVKFVRINAIDTDTDTTQTNYVKLNINYPVFSADEEGFRKAVELFVKCNLTEPVLFTTESFTHPDFGNECLVFRGLGSNFADRFIDTIMYGGNSIEYITPYSSVWNYNTINLTQGSYDGRFGDKIILGYSGHIYRCTMGFYYPISDELRAVIAYKNGYEIDETLFPYAHSILEKASAVIDEIIDDTMTDFEKEKAIYTWMYEVGMTAAKNGYTPVPEGIDSAKAIKTAYGVLNNYGGDCMGWSGTFYTLCNMVGIDCVMVDVLATAGGADENLPAVNHRINMIKLDGEYYFVEAFWSWQKISPDDGAYRYMNMTTQKAANYYSWKVESIGGPFVCDSENYLVDAQTGDLLNK